MIRLNLLEAVANSWNAIKQAHHKVLIILAVALVGISGYSDVANKVRRLEMFERVVSVVSDYSTALFPVTKVATHLKQHLG